MSKPAKPNPLLDALQSIERLEPPQRQVAREYLSGEGGINDTMNVIHAWENPQRELLFDLLRVKYNQDGSPTKPKGRKPRRQEPEKGGGDG